MRFVRRRIVPWPTTWSHGDGPIERLGDHGLKARAAKRALLLNVGSDVREVFVGKTGTKPSAVGVRTLGRIGAERQIDRVRTQERFPAQAKILASTRPGIAFRRIDHGGSYRVELDVSIDGQGVALRVDQARAESAFPKHAGAAVASIERADVALVEQPHGVGEIAGTGGRYEQMNVIAHQHIGMHVDVMRLGGLDQQVTVAPMVIGIDEGRASIDATLCDMKRYIRDEQARAAWHSGRSERMTISSCAVVRAATIGRRRQRV